MPYSTKTMSNKNFRCTENLLLKIIVVWYVTPCTLDYPSVVQPVASHYTDCAIPAFKGKAIPVTGREGP
jgi:hypothetical protein